MPDPFSDPYVTVTAWTARPGRADHIDEIADAFERPTEQDAQSVDAGRPGAEAFWSHDAEVLWPREPAGWPARDLFGTADPARHRRAG